MIVDKEKLLKNNYQVIVIGGGHAGCEAANAASKLGIRTLLITMKIDNLGEMSCNPAIGGIGKGTIVREIDALDGIMAKAIDEAGIHFKILNETKGPAVWGPRAQADRELYKKSVRELLENKEYLDIFCGKVEDLVIDDRQIKAVILDCGTEISTKTLVLTTGTFLSGLIHLGKEKTRGGRIGDEASYGISSSLKKQGLSLGRLKTGTPARLNKNTIDWQILEEQRGDAEPKAFSFMSEQINVPQISCFITETNEKTHEIIRNNLSQSPMYSGQIESKGPRYCPSIEDKISRFASKNRHQVFLEPEGLNSNLVYPNGISTSLPKEIQQEFIRSIRGLEEVEIVRYGYAIEYDYVDPRELNHNLESKKIKNLFLAGQINGTTGYEEAAGQGIIAGYNAALSAENKPSFLVSRADGYIGVMIDDLVNFGVIEPYRMFTSRSEYRISLRSDNADIRLTSLALKHNLISNERKEKFEKKISRLEKCNDLMKSLYITPNKLKSHNIDIAQDGVKRNAYNLLSFGQIKYSDLEKIWPEMADFPKDVKEQIAIEAKYHNYSEKQKLDIEMFKKYSDIELGDLMDYDSIKTLSIEVKEKLKYHLPKNVGSASQIPGITPAALLSLIIHARKK